MLGKAFVPAGRGLVVERDGAVAGYRYELLGHLLTGNSFVEPYRVTLSDEAGPHAVFQHPGLKFIHLLSGAVRYRYASRAMDLKPGDSLLFEATALHGIERIAERPVSYLSGTVYRCSGWFSISGMV